jgi:AcrR family transcriptional regulator
MGSKITPRRTGAQDPANAGSTRDRIVETADDLFYRHGFAATSFADIADEVGISRGNFYHHFRSKDEMLSAVIERRLASTREMLSTWEREADTPEGRIRCFIHILIANWTGIRSFGCPVGTLCNELAKLDHPSRAEARAVFSLFRGWLRRHFVELGLERDADAFAMHVLAWSQGVATLGNAFRDERFVRREVERICAWLAQEIDGGRVG